MEERVYEFDKKYKVKLDELLKADPYEKMSFGRVAPQVKEIDDKLFIYIKSEEDFFKFAEEKFKSIGEVKRASEEDKEKVLAAIKAEEDAASGGFGDVFG